MTHSDAPFVLGLAVAAAQTERPGVYIAMSGRVFRGEDTVKDTVNAIFVDC